MSRLDLTTSSSRSTAAMGAAVREAAAQIRQQLVGHAAKQLKIDPNDVEMRDGVLRQRGTEGTLSLGQVVWGSKLGTLTATGSYVSEGGLDAATGQGIASDHWHQGAVAAEVDVDIRTGKVMVNRLRACVYAGNVVNPVNARMQIVGSIAFGLSQALFEQIIYDNGHVTNQNLSEYALAGWVDSRRTCRYRYWRTPLRRRFMASGRRACRRYRLLSRTRSPTRPGFAACSCR